MKNPEWEKAPGRFPCWESDAYKCFHILPVVGTLQEDSTAKLLGTGYFQFSNKPLAIDGLCKPIPGGMSILAVISLKEGCGNFREFIRQLKEHYPRVECLVDLSPTIGQTLGRYGFRRLEKMDSDGSKIRGWEWTRENSSDSLGGHGYKTPRIMAG